MVRALATIGAVALAAGGDPPCEEAEVRNDSLEPGGGAFICPCFAPGEVAMVVLDTPPGTSATLARIQILWQSFDGGQPDVLEQALIVYDLNQEGPVDTGSLSEIEYLEGPVLVDGFLNEFDVAALNIALPEKRFGLGLEFATDMTQGNPLFIPSISSDDDGHNNAGGAIRNWVLVNGVSWQPSQSLGVSGDWIMRAIVDYCPFPCPWDINDDGEVGTGDLLILLGFWGDDPGGPPDFNEDGIVGTADLLELLANWGPCA